MRRWFVYLSIFLSLTSPALACGAGDGKSTTLIAAEEPTSRLNIGAQEFRAEVRAIQREEARLFLEAVHRAELERLAREEAERVAREQAARRRSVASRSSSTPRTAVPASYSAGSIQAMICEAFGAYCQKAVRVAGCESTFRPDATNGTHHGLFQISWRWHQEKVERRGWTLQDLYDPWKNIQIALEISNGGRNWGAWECQ